MAGKPAGRQVAWYDYTDEQGALLFQTVRYRPKAFRQRRPNGTGGWTWTVKGVRKVLYHLPAVIAAPTVFVCEGEKDADALTGLGVTATTNPLGAGKWRDEFSDVLRGKQVYVIPDGDARGRQHAADVMASVDGLAADPHLDHATGFPVLASQRCDYHDGFGFMQYEP
jgi:5S rRNA maturation endonuclease (ribonuclease M5)